MKTFGQFCAIILGIIAGMLTEGIVLSKMWNWFISPLGVPMIGFWLAVGITLTVGLIKNVPKTEKNKPLSEALIETAAACAAKFIVLGLGAIVKAFI